MTKQTKPRKRNVVIGFTIEDYKKLARASELTYRSKNNFIKKIVLSEVDRILKEAKRGKNAARTN